MEERLGDNSEPDLIAGCRLWSGYVDPMGFPVVYAGKHRFYAHRVAYELAHGSLKKGDQVLRRCGQRLCVNAAHLVVGVAATGPRSRPSGRPSGKPSLADRLMAKAEVSASGCWLWTGWAKPQGYGYTWSGKKTQAVHRIAYRLWVGPIRRGRLVMHRCDQPRCFNPAHLRLGSAADNAADMVRKGRHRNGRNARPSGSKT